MFALGRVVKRPRPTARWLFLGSAHHSNSSSLSPAPAECHAIDSHGLSAASTAALPLRPSSASRRSATGTRADASCIPNAASVERPKLGLVSGCSLQAAPTKLNPLGEDAYFVSEDGRAIGVADGIGAWKQDNIDSGIYAREMMKNAKSYFDAQGRCTDPKKAMQVAYQLTEKHGTCTACILSLRGDVLRAANLGDTGFLILRPVLKEKESDTEASRTGEDDRRTLDVENIFREDVSWELSFKSFEMQYFFNCPVQVGTGTNHTPQNVAETVELPVREGDLIILATDGVFDNLFINDIKSLIARVSETMREDAVTDKSQALSAWLGRLAKTITLNAIRTGLSSSMKTPFAIQARRAGFIHSGGKVDDSTVVVSIVTDEK